MASNSQLPYKVTEESHWHYTFMTKHGIKYYAYFIDASIYHPAFTDVYTFNIETETDAPHPIDNGIARTIVHILKSFFAVKQNAMLMVCDNIDGKEIKRAALFSRWFKQYNDGTIEKYDASAITDDYAIYASILLNKENTRQQELITAFYDLVKNSLYPIGE